jgi:hypothetical protein
VSAGLDLLDATAMLRNVLQGLQSWLDVAARGKAQPQLPRSYVAHWHYQLGVVLAVLEGPRGARRRPTKGDGCLRWKNRSRK